MEKINVSERNRKLKCERLTGFLVWLFFSGGAHFIGFGRRKNCNGLRLLERTKS
jgi:hypothetical protein